MINRLLLIAIFFTAPFIGMGEATVNNFIEAYKVKGTLSFNHNDSLWDQAKATEVVLYPQVSLQPNSVERNTKTVRIKALYNDTGLALLIEWQQPGSSTSTGVGQFADALAVQVPLQYGPDLTLPYIGMGNSKNPVGIWFWRADGEKQMLAAEGFGSLTNQTSDGFVAKGVFENGKWSVVLKRALISAQSENTININTDSHSIVPLSVAIWSGGAGQRNGDKSLSPWRYLSFKNGKSDTAGDARLLKSSGHNGNAKKGLALMKSEGCADCHIYPSSRETPNDGPDLTYSGGIHSEEYLQESIKSPSAVIVPGKSYFTIDDGKKVSAMPDMELSDTDIAHLVSYLKTLR